jgi:MFS transporter, DHA2 family, multidrug resistance protein
MLRQRAVQSIPSLHHEHPSYAWWVLGNVMIGTFMSVLNNTIVNTALPRIMASTGIPLDVAQWISTAYMLAFAVMLPSSGWLADRFGYKRTYAAGIAIFTLFSFLCGLAWNETSLIAFRVFQGFGGGLITPIGMAIVMREFPPERRGIAIGFWSIASAASISFGPLLGGYLVDNFNWHIIFFINVPIGALSIVATSVIQREYKIGRSRSFDAIGFFSMALFLSALLVALSSGNSQWNNGGWTSDFIIGCFAVSFIALCVFLITELNIRHPIVDIRLLGHFNFGFTNLVLFLFGLGMFGSTFLLPLYVQNALSYTAMQSGMLIVPIGIIQGLFSPIAGIFSDRVNPKVPVVAGILLLAFSLYLNTSFSLYTEKPFIMVSLYLRGLAFGLIFAPLSAISLVGIQKKDLAQASGISNVIRQVGGSFGVAIFQSIFTQRTKYHTTMFGGMLDQHSPAFQSVGRAMASYAVHDAGQTMQHAAVQSKMLIMLHVSKQAFVQSINDDFFIASLCTLACAVPVLFFQTNRHKKRAGDAAKG